MSSIVTTRRKIRRNLIVRKKKVPENVKKYVTKKIHKLGELKYFANFVTAPVALPTAGYTVYVLNSSNTAVGITNAQGVRDDQHIGDKIDMYEIHARFGISTTANTSSNYRVILFYLKGVNEVAPVVDDLIQSTGTAGQFVYGNWRPEQKKNVRVLYDKVHNVSSTITGIGKGQPVEIHRKFKTPLTTIYSPNTASTTSTGIIQGGLYMVITANTGSLQMDVLNAQIVFRDL